MMPGAAPIREREHGIVEHLLVMPELPTDIMLSRIWANGLVILVAAIVSLEVVVEIVLNVPTAGSLSVFVFETLFNQISVTGLGIALPAFQAGGALVVLISRLEMLGSSLTKVQHVHAPGKEPEDSVMVPIAMPPVAGLVRSHLSSRPPRDTAGIERRVEPPLAYE